MAERGAGDVERTMLALRACGVSARALAGAANGDSMLGADISVGGTVAVFGSTASNLTASTTVRVSPNARSHTLLFRTPPYLLDRSRQTTPNLGIRRGALADRHRKHPRIKQKSELCAARTSRMRSHGTTLAHMGGGPGKDHELLIRMQAEGVEPRRFDRRTWIRIGLAFVPLVGLQALIALTGNYAFFNLLALALWYRRAKEITASAQARHGVA